MSMMMRAVALVAVVLLACSSLQASAHVSNVQQLSKDTFDEVVGGSAGVLVEFFAPWCGHCRQLAPEYERVAEAFASERSKVVVAAVDAELEEALGARFSLTGYPTLRWFGAGVGGSAQGEEYTGANSAAAIAHFLNSKVGTKVALSDAPRVAQAAAGGKPGAVTAVLNLTPEDFDAHVGGDSAVLVEFYAPWCGHCKNLAPHYERAAQAFRDSSSSGVVRLAAVDADAHPNLGHRFGVKGFPTIKFFAAKSTEGEEYSGARTAEGITTWINNKLHTDVTAPASADFDASAATTAANNKAFEYPSVLKLNSSNVDAIIGGATGVLVEFYAPWCAHCKTLAPEYEEAAAAFKNVSTALIAAIDCDASPNLATRFGVKGFPTIQWFAPGSTVGVEYDGGRTASGLVKFVNGRSGSSAAVAGMVAPNSHSDITFLNASSFDDTVHADPNQDVLVYFFAPWCGHCKRLMPEYERAAKQLKEAGSNVVVTAIDCDEYPELAAHIEGFPTVMFYAASDDPAAAANDAAVTKKSYVEVDLTPSTTAQQLVELVNKHVSGEAAAAAAVAANAAPAGDAAAAAAAAAGATDGDAAAASTNGLPAGAVRGPTSSLPAQEVMLGSEGDARFFHCVLGGLGEGAEKKGLVPAAELKIQAHHAEVQGFPPSFTIDAEQFCTYNWMATPTPNAKQTPSVSVSFLGNVPAHITFTCAQGRQSSRPDVATVSN